MNSKLLLAGMALTAGAALAEVSDRPVGIKIGERMTLKPSVAFSYTYDSNVDSSKKAKAGSQWTVNPYLGLVYDGGHWGLDAAVWYTYHAYNRYSSQLNSSSYGENLNFRWTDGEGGEPAWTVRFTERFEQIAQDDDMSNHNGRGLGRDRKQFNTEGLIDRQITERLHAGVRASYYMLDYDNNVDKYTSLYGWSRAVAGGEMGWIFSKYFDWIVSADYQWYTQDNNYYRGLTQDIIDATRGRNISSDSRGWSVMTGFQGKPTEKLSYRLLGGWSRFEYGQGVDNIDGWTYQASGDWQVDAGNTLHIMLLGSSYYQPSERECGSAIKVYNVSLGVAKGLIRNKLRATADFSFRKEAREYSLYSASNYDEDIYTFRLGLQYTFNQFMAIYGNVEYQLEETTGGGEAARIYDYDRLRGTIGCRLTY